jgi:hypothetical protein
MFFWRTDQSKIFSINGFNWSGDIRQSEAIKREIVLNFRPLSSLSLSYSLNSIDIEGSIYQSKYEQKVHRIKMELNPIDKLNIRAILDINGYTNLGHYLHEETSSFYPYSQDYEAFNPR